MNFKSFKLVVKARNLKNNFKKFQKRIRMKRLPNYVKVKTKLHRLNVFIQQARIQGGGSPDPLRFVRGGVLCRGLMGRRGGPTVVFTLLLSFFSILYKAYI